MKCEICDNNEVDRDNQYGLNICSDCCKKVRYAWRGRRNGRCPRCKEIEDLTNHSLFGGHSQPFILVCRDCHDRIEYEKKVRKGLSQTHRRKRTNGK